MMSIITFLGMLFLLTGGPCFTIVGTLSSSLFVHKPMPNKCYYGKSFSMKEAVCDSLRLEELPDLLSDIEILNFNRNRLRDLTNDTLKKYPDLVFVIIRENILFNIDTGAFAAQEATLKGIDLTDNNILKFPMNTLEYPNFIKLYLGKNYLNDAVLDYAIESGLEVLELFSNNLTKLPTTLSLPELKYLNISKNKISKIKPEELAHFCSLEILDISGNQLKMNGCECNALKKWIKIRKIKLTPVDIKCDKCPTLDDNLTMLNDTFKIYDKCIEKKISRASLIRTFSVKFASSWKYIVSFIVGIFVIIIVVYCACKKGNKKGENLKLNGELGSITNGSIKSQSNETVDLSSTKNLSAEEFITRL